MKYSTTNLLCLLTIVALAMALLVIATTTDRMVKIESAATTYSWRLRETLIAESPVWGDRSKDPPLSLSEALAIADEIVVELNAATKPLGVGRWELNGMTLAPLDGGPDEQPQRWCYLTSFWGVRQPTHTGEPEIFDAIILMNGAVCVGEGNWRPEIDNAMRRVYR